MCHCLNLMVGDILKIREVTLLKEKATSIVKEIKNSHVLHARFEIIQKTNKNVCISLKLPVTTRWNSFIYSLKSLIDTKYALQALAVDDDQVIVDILSLQTKQSLLDDIFWCRVQLMYNLLHPISVWITTFECDKSKIGKVVTCFNEVNIKLQKYLDVTKCSMLRKEQATLKSVMEKRKLKSLSCVHFAAHLLEPSQRSNGLTNEEELVATEFIFNVANKHPKYSQQAVNIIRDLAAYKTRKELFGKEFVMKTETTMEADLWWSGICTTSELSELAVDILNLPVSTAATERSFST